MSPEDIQFNFEQAKTCVLNGESLKAQALCISLLTNDPKESHVYALLGLSYLQVSHYKQATYFLKLSRLINPNHATIRADLSRAFDCSLNTLLALKEAQSALVINPSHPTAHQVLATLFARQRVELKANEQLARTLRSKPEDFTRREELSSFFLDQCIFSEEIAKRILITGVAISPQTKDGYLAIGRLCIKTDQLEFAKISLDRSLKISPSCLESHMMRGMVNLRANENMEAITQFKKCICIAPNQAEPLANFLANQSIEELSSTPSLSPLRIPLIEPKNSSHYLKAAGIFQNLKDDQTAERLAQKAIMLEPDHTGAYIFLGRLRSRNKRAEASCAALEKASRLNPLDSSHQLEYGMGLCESKLFYIAHSPLRISIALEPNNAYAYFFMGLINQERKNDDNALEHFNRSITINDNSVLPAALTSKGASLFNLKLYQASIQCQKEALSLNPLLYEAYCNLGSTYHAVSLLDQAIISSRSALIIAPGSHEAWTNISLAQQDQGHLEEASKGYIRSSISNPKFITPRINGGQVEHDLGRYASARSNFSIALEIDPSNPLARLNKAYMELLFGNFTEGWALYESRFEVDSIICDERAISPTRIKKLERNLQGRKILVWGEQGFGDSIHFVRYVKVLLDRGAEVTIECARPLEEFLRTLDARVRVTSSRMDTRVFHGHTPIMSLPLLLGMESAPTPHAEGYLHVPETRVYKWQGILGVTGKPRVGIAWAGSYTHKNNRNRSLSIKALMPLLELPLEFHSLQKDISQEDELFLSTKSKLILHTKDIKDFSDTAALASMMDLVISVDTSVAHLSGAIAKDTWTLIPVNPDFRWLIDRTDTPWYASLRLYRQMRPGTWDDVIIRLRDDLISRYQLS